MNPEVRHLIEQSDIPEEEWLEPVWASKEIRLSPTEAEQAVIAAAIAWDDTPLADQDAYYGACWKLELAVDALKKERNV